MTVLLLLFILKSNYENRSTTLITFTLTLQILLTYYQNLNPHFYLNDTLGEQFNILLSNSINKFHPALFYVSLLLITIAQPNNLFSTKLHYSQKRDHKELTYFTNKSVRIIIFTLFLGSWWALQEGSWGGWWNWDPSEVFGLVVMLLHLNNLHRKINITNFTDSVTYINLAWKLTLLVYVFIQFNFDLVSHNFGTRVDQFIDSSHNFLLLLLVITLLILEVYVYFIYTSTNSSNLIKTTIYKNQVSWNILLYCFTLAIVVSSFALLVNDFFWKVLQMNMFNSTQLTYYFTPTTLTLLLVRVWNPSILLPIVYLTPHKLFLLPLLLFTSVRSALSMISHTLIIIILLSMCTEYGQNLSLWDLTPENASIQSSTLVSDFFGTSVSLNNFFVEYAKPVLLNNSLTECVWNIVWSSSSPENHNFNHPIMSYYLSQILLSGNTLSQYLIVVVDLSVSSTTMLLIPLTYLFTKLVSKNKIITL